MQVCEFFCYFLFIVSTMYVALSEHNMRHNPLTAVNLQRYARNFFVARSKKTSNWSAVVAKQRNSTTYIVYSVAARRGETRFWGSPSRKSVKISSRSRWGILDFESRIWCGIEDGQNKQDVNGSIKMSAIIIIKHLSKILLPNFYFG